MANLLFPPFCQRIKRIHFEIFFSRKKENQFFFKETLAKGRAPWSGGEQSKTEIRKYPLP